MANMDEKMTCEVVQDLLPLYADGVCTPGSKRLVEEHVKTCEGCRKLLGGMGAPIEGLLAEPTPERTETEALLAAALKRMRSNSRRVVALCLAILIAIPLFVFGGRELTGQGLCLSNWEEYQSVRDTVTTWVEQGSEAAVDSMSPLALYEQIRTLGSDQEVFLRFNKLGAYDGDCSQGKFACLALMGENFYFPGKTFLEERSTNLYLKGLYESGDELAVLRSLMEGGEIMVPESLFHAVTASDGTIDWSLWKSLVLYGEVFYYDAGQIRPADLDYDQALYNVLPDLEGLAEEFLIAAECRVLPETVQRYFEDCYGEIFAHYQAYHQYYEEMGYATFADTWREEMKGLLRELADLGWTVTQGDFRSIAWSSAEECQCVSWQLDMDGHWVYIDFHALDHGDGVVSCVRYPMKIYSYSAPREVQDIFDRINELCSG